MPKSDDPSQAPHSGPGPASVCRELSEGEHSTLMQVYKGAEAGVGKFKGWNLAEVVTNQAEDSRAILFLMVGGLLTRLFWKIASVAPVCPSLDLQECLAFSFFGLGASGTWPYLPWEHSGHSDSTS